MRTRDEAKEKLVRSKALEMLVQEGFNGFSMQKLAKAAGVSPATLYIYFKDKDDLIIQLGIEEGRKMTEMTMKDFSPTLSFEKGLWLQWQNRSTYWMANSIATRFFEQVKHSPYRDMVNDVVHQQFKEIMSQFVQKAVMDKELVPLPLEVFWTVAYGPLFSLIRFHQEGRSVGNRPFTLTPELMKQTFDLVIKALKP